MKGKINHIWKKGRVIFLMALLLGITLLLGSRLVVVTREASMKNYMTSVDIDK